MRSLLITTLFAATAVAAPHHGDPTVETKNGTYSGVHSPEWDQDFFLGVPYAQPPVGSLRFRNPQSLNETWDEPRKATEYSDTCVGYGVSLIGAWLEEGRKADAWSTGFPDRLCRERGMPALTFIDSSKY